MRNLKVFFTFIIIGLIASVTSVKAEVNLSKEDYLKLRMLFSENRVARLTDEEIEHYLSYDFDNINTAQKYYKTVTTSNGTVTTEVSEAEALAGAQYIQSIKEADSINGPTHTTSYKYMHISTSYYGDNTTEIFLYTEWLAEPVVRSFDVTGIRLEDAYVVSGTQFGVQDYDIGSNSYYVTYSYNGTNINNFTNGFGISMNLVDAGSHFSTDINANVVATTKFAKVYGAYQHAVDYISLATSKSYTLNASGLGGVFNFASGALQYYDNMQGVDLSLTYSA